MCCLYLGLKNIGLPGVKVNCLFCILLLGSLAEAQDLTEDEETVEDSIIEDEDDEAEVEEDEPTDLVSVLYSVTHVYVISRIYPFIDKFDINILAFRGL